MNHQSLLAQVSYCLTTGVFTSKVATGNRAAGSTIGNVDAKGYLKALVLGEYVKLHRLAWFYIYGVWPVQQLDHINQVKTDNRISNLRECDTQTNCLNQTGPRKNNTLGFQGVTLIKSSGKYRAKCNLQGKTHHLGVFDTAEEASAAYQAFKSPHLP